MKTTISHARAGGAKGRKMTLSIALKLRHGTLVFLAAVFLAVFAPNDGVAKTKLTAQEVRQIFIGVPWHGPSGVFLFRKDGTYTYQAFSKNTPAGTWSYQMLPDGTLAGNTTNYTFFRRNNGQYMYRHSKTNRNFKAIPNRSAPLE
ncbi:MAG: hypothetical protein AAF035_12170 [Pseudomonadota bacterium]